MRLNSFKIRFVKKTRVGRGIGSGVGKLVVKVIRVINLELDILEKLDLKVDKHHYINVYQNLDLRL